MVGSVYLGKDIRTEKEVALKVERYKGFDTDLFHEYKIYKDVTGCPGISKVYWYAIEGSFNVMVIDRFEVSLDKFFREAPLEIGTLVSFADQMVSTSPSIHKQHIFNRFMY
jgi:serine/threonine protein kinase